MRLKLAAMILMSVAWGQAQQKFEVTGVKAPVPADCVNKVQVLKTQLQKIGAPDKPWTWVVTCTEQTWSLIVNTANNHDTCCAFSILDKGYTYVNGARLTDPLPEVTPGYMIAHELGHITTGSKKEKDADRWAADHGYRWGHKDIVEVATK